MKSPTVAAILNVILPGVGYLYLGKRVAFGKFLLAGTILGMSGTIVEEIYKPIQGVYVFHPVELIAIVGFIFTIVAFGYDAYKLAKEN